MAAAATNKTDKLLPPLPWSTRIKLVALRFIKAIAGSNEGTISRFLFSLLVPNASAPAEKFINSTTTVATCDIPINPSSGLWLRRFIPKTTADHNLRLPLIVYFHGGGFRSYSPDTKFYDHFCSHLAAKVPAVILSVSYRLTPQHRYPAQYDDGFEALKFIDSTTLDIFPPNTDFTNCFIAGDSAGGNIAHHEAFTVSKKGHEFQRLRFVGLVALQPFFGGEERMDSELRLFDSPLLSVNQTDEMWRNFLPQGSDRDHPAAHVWGDSESTEELKKMEFPGVFVVVGGFDPLQDWDRKYVEWLKRCGKSVEVVEYPNAFHGFYAFPELPEFKWVLDDLAKFVQKQINSD